MIQRSIKCKTNVGYLDMCNVTSDSSNVGKVKSLEWGRGKKTQRAQPASIVRTSLIYSLCLPCEDGEADRNGLRTQLVSELLRSSWNQHFSYF